MRRRAQTLAACGVAIAALAVAGFADILPIIVWNASASAPEGLYRIEARRPDVGDYALVASSPAVRSLIVERDYLPPTIPLVKRVAARVGALVCRRDRKIFIDNVVVAYALEADSLGRRLPRWDGCFRLEEGEVLLLSDHERSLDGRYFGATKEEDVIGVALPLWVVKSDAF